MRHVLPAGTLVASVLAMHTAVAALAAAAPLPAQAPAPTVAHQQTLTLQEAIEMAQRQGPAAQLARSTRAAARDRDRAFNAMNLLPQVVLSGDAANLNRGINPITLPDGSTQFVSQAQNQSTLGLGLSQRLPLTGGTLTVQSAVSRIDLFGNQTSKYWQTTPVVVGLQQDLFKPRALVWDERVEALTATVAERSYLEAREDVAANTVSAFFDLYAAQMNLDNAASNAAVNDTLYTLSNGRFEVGKIGENELLQSQLALLRARASVDDAKLARDRAEAALRRMLDYPAGQSFSIVTPDSIPSIDADPDLAVREAVKNSSTVEESELERVQAQRNVTQARLANRFSATVAASVGFNQTAPVFGQAYQSPLGKQALQVSVNMPMVQWGAGRAALEAAKADEQSTAATNRLRRDALLEDARFSVLQLQQAVRNVLISAKADTVAEKGFDVAKNRYVIGKIAILDLYNSQSQKDDAVLSYVAALRNYWTSYYHLRRVTLYDFAKHQEMADERDR
jgi:outer membrane protein TolC